MASAEGVLGGAATGAAAGSTFGLWGAGVGGVIGAMMGLFGDDAKEEALEMIDNWTPEQKQLFQEAVGSLKGTYGQGVDVLKQYLDPNSEVYKNFEKPYLREFKEKTIPGIEEKYAGRGGLSSSGFAQSLGSAASGLQENLASMKQQLQYKAATDIFGQYNQMLNQQPFDYREGAQAEPGMFQQFSGQFLSGFANQYGQKLANG